MQDCVSTVTDFGNVREAVCVSTSKIMDACRDQDCMENVAVYLTQESQETLDCATSVKARSAELLYAEVDVESLGYREGYCCVSVQYYYKVIADAVLCAVKPAAIYGLATANKRVTLFGGEAGAQSFRSDGVQEGSALPTAVVEALDPVILQASIENRCDCPCQEVTPCGCGTQTLPEPVAAAFDGDLVLSGMNRMLKVTLGQFSLIRLERQTQLLIPSYDYCVPEKSCGDMGCGVPENPCQTFAGMEFPVQAFFPQAGSSRLCGSGQSCGCETASAAASESGGGSTLSTTGGRCRSCAARQNS